MCVLSQSIKVSVWPTECKHYLDRHICKMLGTILSWIKPIITASFVVFSQQCAYLQKFSQDSELSIWIYNVGKWGIFVCNFASLHQLFLCKKDKQQLYFGHVIIFCYYVNNFIWFLRHSIEAILSRKHNYFLTI